MIYFKKRLRHNYYKLLLLFVAFWTPLLIFFKIADEIIDHEPIIGDIAILQWLHGHANPVLDYVLFTATTLGGVIGMIVITTLLVLYFLYNHRVGRAVVIIACVGGVTVSSLILKAMFRRDRPSLFESSIVETSFSFPSGHAMASSALVLCLILFTWNTKWRWLVVAVGTAFVLAVGISRPYFGIHYPSDIIAGWCVSIGWVLLVFFVTDAIRIRRGRVETVEPKV